MEPSARLYLCARCHVQVVVCRRCDRGNRYCGRLCRGLARAEARRQAAQRYQRSWRGRLAHALRSRRWRQRQAAARRDNGDAQNVTHQGSRAVVVSAPLAAWTHDSLSVGPADMHADTTLEPTAEPNAQRGVTAHGWRCWRCGERQPAIVRLGFVRHGLPARWRHDHWP